MCDDDTKNTHPAIFTYKYNQSCVIEMKKKKELIDCGMSVLRSCKMSIKIGWPGTRTRMKKVTHRRVLS